MGDRQQQSQQSADDNKLILYRLNRVEQELADVNSKLDKLDNIKKSDLIEFRDTIINRVHEVRDDLQKQVDSKADQKQVDDLRTLIKAVGSIIGSVIAGLTLWFITSR